MKNPNIEIIEDNAGGLTIQNTETRDVCHWSHKSQADAETLKAILDGHDMAGWDLSDPECYISDEYYAEHALNGGLRTWDDGELAEWIESL